MNSDPQPAAADERHIWSCVTCRRRKVKCDRREPCDVCLKNGIDCHYPVTGRLPNRSRAPPQWSSAHHKQTDLLERLRRLEAVVTELSAQVDEVNDGGEQLQPTPSLTTASEESGNMDETFGQLVTGGDGRVKIAKSFWSVFCNEVDHIFQSIQDASELNREDMPKQAPSSNCCCQSFGLGVDMASPSTVDVSPTQTSFLLQTYKERVDPFVKVLSADSLKHLCDSWSSPDSDLGLAQVALRSSVLFAAVVSLTPSEVKAAFGQGRDFIRADIRIRAETTLAQAKYMSTRYLTVVQALVIYASMLPYAGMQDTAGPITASLVQIAVQSGLHLETTTQATGTNSDIRKLVWLQICFMSSRFQVADAAVSEWPPDMADVTSSFDRLCPNDNDQRQLLHARYLIWSLSRQLRRLGRADRHEDAESLVNAAKSRIEEQFPVHSTSQTPFTKFIQKMSQLFFTKIKHALLAQKGQHEKVTLFASSPSYSPLARALSDTTMATLEAMHALSTHSDWALWRWQLQGFFPWAAMKLVFVHFSECRWTPLSERAWVLANAVVGSVSVDVKTDAAWSKLCELMKRAEEHRQREMERLMADAMEGGDYMEIIEAGQQVFYSEGLDGSRINDDSTSSDKGIDDGSNSSAFFSPPLTVVGDVDVLSGWPDELAAMDAIAW